MIAIVNIVSNVEPILESTLHLFQGVVYEYNRKKEV